MRLEDDIRDIIPQNSNENNHHISTTYVHSDVDLLESDEIIKEEV